MHEIKLSPNLLKTNPNGLELFDSASNLNMADLSSAIKFLSVKEAEAKYSIIFRVNGLMFTALYISTLVIISGGSL